jgi:hypothetical protein
MVKSPANSFNLLLPVFNDFHELSSLMFCHTCARSADLCGRAHAKDLMTTMLDAARRHP